MGEERENKNYLVMLTVILIIILLLMSFASAGFFNDIWKKITGEATKTVVLNITVGVPRIITVYNTTINVQSGPNEAPSNTTVLVNFSVYSPSNAGNLNHTTAKVNITAVNEGVRTNSTCSNTAASGDYANYSCGITMWWWDGTGSWNITAYIADNNTNTAQNFSTNFYVGSRTAFAMSPATLTWSSIGAGAINQTSNNDPLLLNNTGNDPIAVGSLDINATNLLGEQDQNYGLWAGNISANWSTGGSPSAECVGTVLNASFYKAITGANLSAGNYTINDGAVGQEQLYFCINLAGSELTTQPYSTARRGAWTVQIS